MRNKLWLFAIRNHPEGKVLSCKLLFLRAILFPLDSFYWRMSKSRGYNIMNDTWSIYGVVYSNKSLVKLSNAQGETFKVTRSGKCVILEKTDT